MESHFALIEVGDVEIEAATAPDGWREYRMSRQVVARRPLKDNTLECVQDADVLYALQVKNAGLFLCMLASSKSSG